MQIFCFKCLRTNKRMEENGLGKQQKRKKKTEKRKKENDLGKQSIIFLQLENWKYIFWTKLNIQNLTLCVFIFSRSIRLVYIFFFSLWFLFVYIAFYVYIDFISFLFLSPIWWDCLIFLLSLMKNIFFVSLLYFL